MKIAIIKLSALGDIVHAMIVLQFIKKYNPEVLIDWVVEDDFRGLLENNPHINQIHRVKLKAVKQSRSIILLWKELRKVHKFGKYDLVIDMQGLVKSSLVARIIPSDITFGFEKTSLREGFAATLYNKTFKMDYSENVIERNIALVSYALNFTVDKIDIQYKQPFLYSSKNYLFNSISHTQKNILLIPGASYQSKSYPVEKFSELSKKINASFLVIWGSEKEKAMADELKYLSPQINVLEKLSLDSLISLISQVDLVVGADTGTTHIAWALNIPSITLFGPTPGYRNAYVTSINKIIESNSEVDPNKIDKSDYSINNIKVNDISKLAQKLLEVSE